MPQTNQLEHLKMDAEARAKLRVQRIAKHPGRATMDDVAWLCVRVTELQNQLDYINNELPRVRMLAASRAGSMGK